MKSKNGFLQLILLIIIIILIVLFIYGYNHHKTNSNNEWNEKTKKIEAYLQDIYGRTFLIPEFTDINKADEQWLWENINQYIWNHEDEYKEKIEEEYGFTYEDISKIAQKLYGSNFKKEFPKGAVNMRYDSYNDMYGVTAYSIDYYYDYKISTISQNGNIYTVSLYDYVVSSFKSFGNYEDKDHDNFDVFNIYDFELNGDDATPIISFKDFKDKEFVNLLDNKDKLTRKTLTLEFDESTNSFYIKSCEYKDTSSNDILSESYRKVIDSFEIMNLEYDREDVYELDEIEVTNFDELASIYTDNGKEIFKNEYSILNFKDDGKIYIKIGEELDTINYLSNIHFENIYESGNKITATCIREFRESFDPSSEGYNNITTDKFTFTIMEINTKWLIDEFKFNKQ